MLLVKKLKFLLPVLCLLPLSTIAHISGNEAEEAPIEETAEVAIPKSRDHDRFVELYRNDKYIYSFKEELDIIQVQDVNTKEVLWKTGADAPYISEREAKRTCTEELAKDPNYVCQPYEDTYGLGIINSLLTIYYYQLDNNTYGTILSAQSADDYLASDSTLMRINGSDNHYRFDVDFANPMSNKKLGIKISLHIYFDEKGIEFEIRNNEITGENANRLTQITIAPFTGATGGEHKPFDYEKMDFSDDIVSKEYANGYIVVPDGSGSIIPFKDNSVALGKYQSYVYGENYSNLGNYISPESNKSTVPLKAASMPMYGIVHNASDNNVQKAIAAYATKGEQHMAINVSPDKADNDEYVYAYATFQENFSYTEYYSQDGTQRAPVLNKKPFDYDIGLRFDFLEGSNANYVGIAKAYRDHLINVEKQLTKKTFENDHIITRLDFIMADAEDSVLGTIDAVVTTADNVKEILNDALDNNVDNIVTSLHGWQSGGVTLGSPDDADFSSKIGSASKFKSLISSMRKKGVDVSFAQDYFLINEKQISFSGNATKHINGKYVEYTSFNYNFIMEFGYARSDASLEWVKEQNSELREETNVKSMTVSGISNNVLSHHKGTREKAMKNIDKAFAYLNKKGLVNADQPNKYLWKYVDRYFNTPVSDSQHLIEEKEIPLLQLVLKGCMEMYAPYSNFSFYDQESVLKMIDFNVYPSFILSKKSSHYLAYTNSAHYYSTEYTLYRDKIQNIYSQIDEALSGVINAEWINRSELDNGLIVNEYSNGKKIVINYSNSPLTYDGLSIPSQGFEVL